MNFWKFSGTSYDDLILIDDSYIMSHIYDKTKNLKFNFNPGAADKIDKRWLQFATKRSQNFQDLFFSKFFKLKISQNFVIT